MTAYAAHPERFVRKPPQPPILPHAVWINPPKEPSASQTRAGATISTADDQRVALNGEGLGVLSKAVGVSLHVFTTSTSEVLQEMPMAKCRKARRVANRLARKIEIVRYDQNFTVEAREDLLDDQYVEKSIEALLRSYVPEYKGPVHFKARPHGDKLIVESDILFPDANLFYHQRIPATHSSLSPAYLLAHLLSVKADMHFAARYDSEIAIDDINTLIIY